MGCCRDFFACIFRCWLLICNLIDVVIGCTLIGYGIWFTSNVGSSVQYNQLASLFWILPLSIGVLMVVSAGLSLTGVAFEDEACGRCLLGLSAALSVVLAILMLVTGTLMWVHREDYFDYLDEHTSSSSAEALENWYKVLAVAFFATAALQTLRCASSRKLVAFVNRDASELRAAFLEDRSEFARHQDEAREEIRAKYDDKREAYRAKYGGGIRNTASAASTEESKSPDLI